MPRLLEPLEKKATFCGTVSGTVRGPWRTGSLLASPRLPSPLTPTGRYNT